MRDELHLMELVDRYLDGSMNAVDRAAFEVRASKSAELRELIDDQRALREGVARVPVRAAAAKAYRAYRFGKPGPWIGGAVVVAVVIISAWLLWQLRATAHEADSAARTTETEASAPAPAMASDTVGTGIAPLVMVIDPSRDTTILTPSGLVLDVPKGSFVDSTGAEVTSAVRITMLEALDASTIMKAGLSTMSGDTLLETGGMFYIDAHGERQKLSIATGRELNVLMPADGIASDMMLYDGVMREDNVIDWKDPKSLPRTLVPVDITTLDFYPLGYTEMLTRLGQNAQNKAYRDSLYFSFECTTATPVPAVKERLLDDVPAVIEPVSFEGLSATLPVAQAKTAAIESRYQFSPTDSLAPGPCGISPAKVKAIWNERFNGTNLATREFEERMHAIHGTCNNAVLDLYVNNLTEDLRTLDRKAAQLGYSAFAAFAKRSDGRVDLPAESAERLKRLYADWSRSHAEAARKAQDAFWAKQMELDAQINKLAQTNRQAELEARAELLKAETEANLRSVYEQAGYAVSPWSPSNASPALRTPIAPPRPPVVMPTPPRTAFRAAITTTGWKNCDRAFSAAYARQTFDMYNGTRKATLTYEPCVITVPEAATYDAMRVYLMPQEGRAYQRMDAVAPDRFQENLNLLYTYDAVVLAHKGGKRFYFEANDIKGRSVLTASLAPVTEQQLTTNLMRYERARGTGLLNASNYMTTAAKDMKRTRANMNLVRIRAALLPVVYPCSQTETDVPASEWAGGSAPDSMQIFTIVEDMPTFPGGVQELLKYLGRTMRYPRTAQNAGISGVVYVTFVVDENGNVTNPRVSRGIGGGCDEEAIRVVKAMPQWEPGRQRGQPVRVQYNLPIRFIAK